MTATPPPARRPRGSRRAVAPVTDPTTAEGGVAATTEPTPVEAPEVAAAATTEPTPVEAPEVAVAAAAPEVGVAQGPEASQVASPAAETGKKKTAPTSAAPPVDESDTPDETAEPDEPTTPRRRLPALALALTLVGVLCLGGAAGFVWKAHEVRSTDSATNLALVDTPLTNEVVGQVSAGLNRIFSYDSTKPATTQEAADALLVGDASGQYKTLFQALQAKAAGQQLTLSTKTLLGGVSVLTPTTARLLVFLDQTATRSSDSSSSTAAAQLSVAAEKHGTVWKISEIRPL